MKGKLAVEEDPAAAVTSDGQLTDVVKWVKHDRAFL